MNFEEHAAKPLLQAAGIAIPRGQLARSATEAEAAAVALGVPVVVKAQVPAGKRGKAGGIRSADDPELAREAANAILGMDIAGHRVEAVLVEERAAIATEYYAAVLNDAASKGPLVVFSPEGGMDIEEIAASKPDRLRKTRVDILRGFDLDSAHAMLGGLGLGADQGPVAETLVALYLAYRENDAELLEINPLARLADGRLVALDCKFTLDDSALRRREELARRGSPEPLTALEARARALGLKYIELDGDVGVLANGAGLTMTTMDVIAHHGGRPANFLEIGGAAYTKARPALELVLDNRRVTCLVVNFCGAFARTDVMIAGVLDTWEGACTRRTGLLQRARHGLDRGESHAPRASRRDPLRDDGRGDRRRDRRGPRRRRGPMIVRGDQRVLVQGITGRQGTYWTERMQAYGTRIVAGVNPKKAGTLHCGVPVFASARDAMREVGFDVSVLFIPPLGVKAAAQDAIEAGCARLVVLTEHVPVQDVMELLAMARANGGAVVGPNTAGLVTPGECFVGFMPAFESDIFQPGRVAVISRSGSLGTLVCLNLVQAGFGQSAFIGIGGDPIIGTTTRDALQELDADERTGAVVVVGEIGGTMEEDAAEYAQAMAKPVVAFIAGSAAPPGKKMGHAGAIVMGDRGTYVSKRKALEAAGVEVLDTPSEVGRALRARLG